VSDKPKPVTVRILDQDFRIACEPGEEDSLLSAARHLDKRMQDLRATGKVIGAERIAIMVALNLTHEHLQLKNTTVDSTGNLIRRLKQMRERVESALNDSSQLEL
jgi:cell division protein ZapA